MDPEALVDELEAHGTSICELVGRGDFDAVVPTCPGWTIRDLVQHLGGIHRWAATYVDEQRLSPIDMDLDELVGGWPKDEHLLGWFADGHGALVNSLRSASADLECFTFLDAPSPLHMWSRRQAHETAIHRVDAEVSLGREVAFEPEFAVDGIDELLRCFLTRRGRGPRADVPRVLEAQATDADAQWRVAFDDRACWIDDDSSTPDVIVEGEASLLYQLLWNRIGQSSVSVTGDAAVLDIWRETAHVRWN